MRINQIQNLCWAANGLVFLGMAWVGYQFVDVAKHRKDVEEFTWPKKKAVNLDTQRWPGEVTRFKHIWGTWVNGEVPKKAAPKVAPKVNVDPKEVFRKALKYRSGWHFLATPSKSKLEVEYNGTAKHVSMGESLDGWQLCGYHIERLPKEEGKPLLVKNVTRWNHGRHGLVVLEQMVDPASVFEGGTPKAFEPEFDPTKISADAVNRSKIVQKGYQKDDLGLEWVIPEDEQLWWEVWGKEDVFDKLSVRPHVDASGTSHGIKMLSTPGPGTALEGDRGIIKDDVVKSINGVPMGSKEAVLAYLKGDGKGLRRYDVVIERAGKERTVTYHVPRPKKPGRN